MYLITFTQFKGEVQALPSFNSKENNPLGFSAYPAFLLIQIQLLWSKRLKKWDSGLHPKLRPWIYMTILVFLLAGLILPQWFADQKPNATSPILVSIIPVVPIEPTWIPDTLINNLSFTKPTHQ